MAIDPEEKRQSKDVISSIMYLTLLRAKHELESLEEIRIANVNFAAALNPPHIKRAASQLHAATETLAMITIALEKARPHFADH